MMSLDSVHYFPQEFMKPMINATSVNGTKLQAKALLEDDGEHEEGDEEFHNRVDNHEANDMENFESQADN